MTLLRRFLRQPKQLWIRKVNFQIHRWTGIVLALYLTAMGLTGSILVFSDELTGMSAHRPWHISAKEPWADASIIIGSLAATYPHTHILSVMAPTKAEPFYLAILQIRERTTVACHPVTGRVLGELRSTRTWLDLVREFHENLFLRRTGRILNGTAAAFLLLLIFSGLVNWWPGVKNWRSAITVDFQRRWPRLTFDLHSAVGFWAAAFLSIWAFTGVYFAWPENSSALVNHLSPIINSRPPKVSVDADSPFAKLDFRTIIQNAYFVNPGTKLRGIIFPASRRSPLEILLLRSESIGRDNEDTVYFNPYNGAYITTWRYGVNQTLGDWFIWLQQPLHFGTNWGLGIKVVWATAGLTLPLLSVTGLMMYWNRVLKKQWSTLQKSPLRP